jgi:hypothetical protein
VIRNRSCSIVRNSKASSRAVATFYSLIGTAKLNGLNLEAYLRDGLIRVADHPVNRIEELWPWDIGFSAAQ